MVLTLMYNSEIASPEMSSPQIVGISRNPNVGTSTPKGEDISRNVYA